MNRRRFIAAAGAPIVGAWLGGAGRVWALDAGDRTFGPGRVGAIVKGSTKPADLEKIFGADNVKRTTIHAPGGGEENPGANVFPDSPDKLEVTFSEDSQRIVLVSMGGGKWRSRQGLRIGSTLADIERIHGGPFNFYGFRFDYGGKLTTELRGHRGIDVYVQLSRNAGSKAADRFTGETIFSSRHPGLKAFGLDVVLIQVDFVGA